jgi:hypothetical protein
MPRANWVALVTEPAAEYAAATELQRFGLTPYLPQIRKRWCSANIALTRLYPLFPRYLLLPARDSAATPIHIVRGLRRYRPILASQDGRPWLAPDFVIDGIRQAEADGRFNELLLRGDRVRLTSGILQGLNAKLERVASTDGLVELLGPLFGGSRMTAPQGQVARL